MNDLEMTTAKICSAREIIDAAIDRLQEHQYDKAETMMSAAYEFLEYYLNEFDEKFKLAWQETVVKQKKEEDDAWNATIKEKEYYEPSMPPWGHSDLEYQYKIDPVGNYVDPPEDKASLEYQKSWTSFWDNYNQDPVTGQSRNYQGSTVSSVQYTDEELNAMCDKAEADQKTLKYQEAINAGWTMTGDGFWMSPQKEDKVKKWVLPVEMDGPSGEYFVMFPDDLLGAANLEEGDQVEWIDQGDGSYLLKKIDA